MWRSERRLVAGCNTSKGTVHAERQTIARSPAPGRRPGVPPVPVTQVGEVLDHILTIAAFDNRGPATSKFPRFPRHYRLETPPTLRESYLPLSSREVTLLLRERLKLLGRQMIDGRRRRTRR
jgi:hypothetical protein